MNFCPTAPVAPRTPTGIFVLMTPSCLDPRGRTFSHNPFSSTRRRCAAARDPGPFAPSVDRLASGAGTLHEAEVVADVARHAPPRGQDFAAFQGQSLAREERIVLIQGADVAPAIEATEKVR